jgi:hypothetical protein
MTGQVDFYSFDPDETPVSHNNLADSEIEGFKIANRMLNFYGENYEYYVKYDVVQNEWVGTIAYVVRDFIFLLPSGYDGIIVYFSNAGIWTDTDNRTMSDNFDNNTLFFRVATRTH